MVNYPCDQCSLVILGNVEVLLRIKDYDAIMRCSHDTLALLDSSHFPPTLRALSKEDKDEILSEVPSYKITKRLSQLLESL